jgi:hypothetical protein
MAAKNSNHTKMNRAEYALNKPLLKEANEKMKALGASQKESAAESMS